MEISLFSFFLTLNPSLTSIGKNEIYLKNQRRPLQDDCDSGYGVVAPSSGDGLEQ